MKGEKGEKGETGVKGEKGQTAQSDSPAQGNSPGQNNSPSGRPSATSESPSQSSSADTDARTRMLEAKQKALREQASELARELAKMALPELSNHAAIRNEAQKHLDEAIENMQSFEETLADLRYHPEASEQEATNMTETAETAAQELVQASQAIAQGLINGKQLTDAEKAEALAKQLEADAEALDESVSPKERDDMLKRLEAAEQLLENKTGAQWATVSKGGPGSSLVYTKGGPGNRAETARLLAQQFWSIAIQARNRQVRSVEDEPSDVEFFEAENDFFENAAKFKPPDDTR